MKPSELLEQLQQFPCPPDTEVLASPGDDKTLFVIKEAIPIALPEKPIIMLALEQKAPDET